MSGPYSSNGPLVGNRDSAKAEFLERGEIFSLYFYMGVTVVLPPRTSGSFMIFEKSELLFLII